MSYHIVLRLYTLCHLEPMMLFCQVRLCIPPDSPVHLRVTFHLVTDWTPTTGLYHARFCQDLHMSHSHPLAGRRKSAIGRVPRPMVLKRSIPLEIQMYDHIQNCLPIVIDWASTTRLIKTRTCILTMVFLQ